jgi:hypothetical protein
MGYLHPSGALGLGVVLGAASEGLPGGGNGSRHSNGRNGDSHSDGASSGMLGGLVTSMLGPTADTVRDELRNLVKEGFSSLHSKKDMTRSSGQMLAIIVMLRSREQ